ncbi:MAG TPA: hypothetical protein VLF43_04530 [Candidatus Saccharimonadales bacterium]|nr:hypothetical protein [Candidatus Saccharimonadales bacterium]
MKSKLIIVAVAVIGLASVAYAAYSQTLNVNGSGTAAGDWNVAITNITQTAATGATENSAPAFDDTSATFDVDLAYPGASAEYDVTVTNAGSIPAALTSITDLTTLNAAAPAYITYTTSGVTGGGVTKLTPSGGTNVLHVIVRWTAGSAPATTGTTKPATITLNYDQDT